VFWVREMRGGTLQKEANEDKKFYIIEGEN
jgi:hypothetical protein